MSARQTVTKVMLQSNLKIAEIAIEYSKYNDYNKSSEYYLNQAENIYHQKFTTEQILFLLDSDSIKEIQCKPHFSRNEKDDCFSDGVSNTTIHSISKIKDRYIVVEGYRYCIGKEEFINTFLNDVWKIYSVNNESVNIDELIKLVNFHPDYKELCQVQQVVKE